MTVIMTSPILERPATSPACLLLAGATCGEFSAEKGESSAENPEIGRRKIPLLISGDGGWILHDSPKNLEDKFGS